MKLLSLLLLLIAASLATFYLTRKDTWEDRFNDYGVLTFQRRGKGEKNRVGSDLQLFFELVNRRDPNSILLSLALSHFDNEIQEKMHRAFWNGLKDGEAGKKPEPEAADGGMSAAFYDKYKKVRLGMPFDKDWSKRAFQFAQASIANRSSTFGERAAAGDLLVSVYRVHFAESESAKKLLQDLANKVEGREAEYWRLVISVMEARKRR